MGASRPRHPGPQSIEQNKGGARPSRRIQAGATFRLLALVCLVACLPAVRAYCNFDAICDPGETEINCPSDCIVVATTPTSSSCNFNAVCDPGEDEIGCFSDCNGSTTPMESTPAPAPSGCVMDSFCDVITETAVSCPSDCSCGDSICDMSELTSCPMDCGTITATPPPQGTEVWCNGKCQCDTFTAMSGMFTDGSPFGNMPNSRLEWLGNVYDAGSSCNWIIAPEPMPPMDESGMGGEMEMGRRYHDDDMDMEPTPAPVKRDPVKLKFAEFWLGEGDSVSIYSCETVEGCSRMMNNTNGTNGTNGTSEWVESNAEWLDTFSGTLPVKDLDVESETGIMLVHFESAVDSMRYPGFKALWKSGDAEFGCFDSDQCSEHEICNRGECVNNLCGEGLICDECRSGHNPCMPHEVCVDWNATILGDATCECDPICDGMCDDENYCEAEVMSVCHGRDGNPCTNPMYPVCHEVMYYPDGGIEYPAGYTGNMPPSSLSGSGLQPGSGSGSGSGRIGSGLPGSGSFGPPIRRSKSGRQGPRSLKHGMQTRRMMEEEGIDFVCVEADRCKASPTACPDGYLCQDPCVANASYWEMQFGTLEVCTSLVSVKCGGVDECEKYPGICGDKDCKDTNFGFETGDPGQLCEYDECENTMNLCHYIESHNVDDGDANPFKMNRPETVGECVDTNPFKITGSYDPLNLEIMCKPNACYDMRGNPKCGVAPCRERDMMALPGYDGHNYQCHVDECEQVGCGKDRSCRDPDWWTDGDFQCGVDECEMEGSCMMMGTGMNATMMPMPGMCHDPNFMKIGDYMCGVEVDECAEGMYMCGPGERCVENSTWVKDDWMCMCTCDHGCDMDGKCMMADECEDDMLRRMACPDERSHCRDDDHKRFGGVQCGVDECAMADKFCYNCDGQDCHMQVPGHTTGGSTQSLFDGTEGAVSCRDPNFMIEGDVQCGASKADLCLQVPYEASEDTTGTPMPDPLRRDGPDNMEGDLMMGSRTVGDICMDYLDGMRDRYGKVAYPTEAETGGCRDDDLIGFAGAPNPSGPGDGYWMQPTGEFRPVLTWAKFRQVCGIDECAMTPGICGKMRCKDMNRLSMDGPDVICEKDDCEEGHPCLPEEMCMDTNPFKHAEKDFKGTYDQLYGQSVLYSSDRLGFNTQLSMKIYEDGVMCAIDECENSCRPTEDCRDPNPYVKGDVMCGLDECTRNPCGPKETCMDYNFMRFGDFVCEFDECKQMGEPLCKWFETCRDTDLQNYGGVQCGVDECAFSQKYGSDSTRYLVGADPWNYAPSQSQDVISDFASCMPQDKCFDPDFSVHNEGICDDGLTDKMACRPTTQDWQQLSTAENPHMMMGNGYETPFKVHRGKTSRCIPSKVDPYNMKLEIKADASYLYNVQNGFHYYSHCVDYKSCNEGWVDECVGDPCNSMTHSFAKDLRENFYWATTPLNDDMGRVLDPTDDGLHGHDEPDHLPTWSGPFTSGSGSGSGSGHPSMAPGSMSSPPGSGSISGSTTSPMPTGNCDNNGVCMHGLESYAGGCADCAMTCGDGVCDLGTELYAWNVSYHNGCPEDCMTECGNFMCNMTQGEDPYFCPEDCPNTRRSGAAAPKATSKPLNKEQLHHYHAKVKAFNAKHSGKHSGRRSARRTTSGKSHQDSDLTTQWSCRDRDWTKMAAKPLDICGIDECQQRPYPCGHSFENCIDRDITKAGTVTCWVDECRIDDKNPCHADQKCFDKDIFELDTPLECMDTLERPWGKRPEYADCMLGPWETITEQLINQEIKFETSSLGKLRTPDVNTWVCVEGHECASQPIAPTNSSHFCFVYHEQAKQFVSWGTAAETKLLYNTSSCSATTVF